MESKRALWGPLAALYPHQPVAYCALLPPVYVRESEELFEQVRGIALETLLKALDSGRSDKTQIKQRVKDEVSKFLYSKTKRKPMVLPVIMNL